MSSGPTTEASPLVSVLMTTFNREQFVAEAVNSVLSSSYENLELIIVDDCSEDATMNILEQCRQLDSRIQVYRNKTNVGDYPNRNKAASYAVGKYLKYLDSDDIMYPHCLQVMVNSMEQFPDAGYGLSAERDEARPYPYAVQPYQAYTEHFNGLGHFNRAPGSAIIKASAFSRVGGFSGERMIGDFDLWLRLGMYYDLVKLPVDLYWARTHQGQESQSGYANQYAALREQAMRKAFSHEDCPLFEEDISRICRSHRRLKIRRKIWSFLKV